VSGFEERGEQLVFESVSAASPSEASVSARDRGELVREMDAIREKYGDGAVLFGREIVRSERLRKATETPDND
jgi:hypothetical protein